MVAPRLKQNKRGWIRIMEALISILIIASVLLVIIQREFIGTPDYSTEVYNKEVSMFRGIRLNDSLRDEIIVSDVPKEWTSFPEKTKLFIQESTPSYLDCRAKLCSIEDPCPLTLEPEAENFYTRSGFFAASEDTLNPKKIKLYCKIIGR